MEEKNFGELSIEKLQDVQLNFLIGIGRSGSNLLLNILEKNSKVHTATENNFVLFAKDLSASKNKSNEELYTEMKHLMKSKHNYATAIWKPNFEKMDRLLPSIKRALSYEELCKLLYLSQNESKTFEDLSVIVNKNLVYSLYLEELMTLFPKARFIVIVRDYRDNGLSRKENFGKGIVSNSFFYLAQSWKQCYQAIEKVASKNSARFSWVRYEDLVTNTESEVEKLVSFLDVKLEEEMFRPEKDKSLAQVKPHFEKIMTGEKLQRELKMHERLTKPIDTKKVAVWKTKLSTHQLRILEIVCGDLGQKLGYSPSKQYSVIEKIGIHFSAFLLLPLTLGLNKLVRWKYLESPLWFRKKVIN